jgi:hypothetical protein
LSAFGDHGQAIPVAQQPDELRDGGAAGGSYHPRAVKEPHRVPGDALFLRQILRLLVAQRQVVEGRVDRGAAVRAADQPLLLKRLQVTPYGRRGNGEFGGQRRHVHLPARHDRGHDLVEAPATLHGSSAVGPV